MKIRLLGDRVLQKVAWDIAEQPGLKDTMQAEYVALTRLQADAFVTLDAPLAESLEGVVPLRSFDEIDLLKRSLEGQALVFALQLTRQSMNNVRVVCMADHHGSRTSLNMKGAATHQYRAITFMK